MTAATATLDIESLATEFPSLFLPCDTAWQPPSAWADSSHSHDTHAWIEALAAHNLRPKATSAFSCGDYYIPIAVVAPSHYVRLGRATCQCKTCRKCGTAKMSIHRMHQASPARLAAILDQSVRTLRLTISYATPAEDLPSYILRVLRHRRDLAALRRRMRRDFGGEFGYLATVEFDPRRRDVIFRVYYVGHDPRQRWFEREWQRIVGLRAQCESKFYSANHSREALHWTYDAITPILLLPGAERAAWESAMQGNRFSSVVGTLRGLDPDPPPPADDPAAPLGRCPCGCGQALTRPESRKPGPRSDFESQYKIVDFGAVKPYVAYRAKVNEGRAAMVESYGNSGRFRHPPPG